MYLSLIIPMYNVEHYIYRCLNSCLNQDLPSSDYEIIVIDDGSTDNSYSIAKKIAEQTNNIKIIQQTNKGLSCARNIGLSLSKGNIIWFIDSDDWIQKNCLKSLVEYASRYEVTKIGSVFTTGNKIIKEITPIKQNDLLSSTNFEVPFYIYKRDFLLQNNLQFMPNIFHEDMEFTSKVLCLSKNQGCYPKPLYFYFQRESSITGNINIKRSYDYIKIVKSLLMFGESQTEQNQLFLYNVASLAINNALHIATLQAKENKKEFNSFLIKNKELLIALKLSNISKYRKEYFYFKFIFFLKPLTSYTLLQIIKEFFLHIKKIYGS